MLAKVLKLLRRYLKTSLLVSFIVLYFYVLPELMFKASLLYFKDWQIHAERSAMEITKGQPYCIVVPTVEGGWQVVNNFQKLDIRSVVKGAVQWKFDHFDFDLADHSYTLREREVHFGILFNKKLYYWSFLKNAFFDARAHGYADVTYRSMRETEIYIHNGRAKTVQQLYTMADVRDVSDLDNEQIVSAIRSGYGKHSYRHWRKTLAEKYPRLTPDDFICEHL